MLKVAKSFLSLVVLIFLSSCQHTKVKVPNTEFCAVAGVISAGADCGQTLSPATREMTLDEFIDFLEPQPERPNPDRPGEMLPEKGAAICQSAKDYNRNQTALEIACVKLGNNCDAEMQSTISTVKRNYRNLQKKVMTKRTEVDQ